VRRTSWQDVKHALASGPPARVAEPSLARAAVALILRDGPTGLELLFIRRAEHDADPWSGQMGFPGGRAEDGDADLRQTAIRETREEIGIDLARQGALLGLLDEVRAMARMRPQNLVIAPHVFRLAAPAEPVAGPEVTSVHWLPLDEIRQERWISTMDYPYQGATLQFPCLRYEGLVIWGLTFRMFTGFAERLATVAPGPEPEARLA
jgi:8-oxo-dGTP pyrophosphatase MutT (NUDIX family)